MYKVIQIEFKLFVQENHVFHKTCMCSLGEPDEKKIISKFQRLEILSQMVAKVKKKLYKFPSCLYSSNSNF
jgi:hypothetical protein